MKVVVEVEDGEIINIRGDAEGKLIVIDHDLDQPVAKVFSIPLGNVDDLLRDIELVDEAGKPLKEI